jgi:hypothetical protein
MACEIYILSCPIGAIGDECTFEIDCCGGQTVSYTMQPDSIVDACVDDQGTVTVTSLSGSASSAFEECSSDCGDIPAVPTSTPTATPTATPTPTPSPTPGPPTPTPSSTPVPTLTPTPTPVPAGYNYFTLTACPGGGGTLYSSVRTTFASGVFPGDIIEMPDGRCYEIDETASPANNNDYLNVYADCDTCLIANPTPTPTPPPTPTPTPSGCNQYELEGGAGGGNFSYTDCSSNPQTEFVPDGDSIPVCGLSVPILTSGNGNVVFIGPCIPTTPTPTPSPTPGPPTPTPGPPTATPTATPTPTPTPTAPIPTSVVPPIPSPVETEYTLTYSQTSKGWPSFYSYIPDYMLGMNQYFYSFNGGNLYQHNANGNRNNFYGEQYNSQITTVFNQNPLENKIFKTINLESDQAWQANLETDIQQNGFIESAWFKEKEGAYFAFLRQNGEVPALPGQYAMRSANGIGKSTSVSAIGNTTTINFSTNPLVDIGSIVSVGDYLYFSLPSYTTISLAGQITNINVDIPAGINQILIDTSITGTSTITIQDPYILYIKSSVAESHGLLGHYCIFTLINESTKSTELFAVESEVMKSYP